MVTPDPTSPNFRFDPRPYLRSAVAVIGFAKLMREKIPLLTGIAEDIGEEMARHLPDSIRTERQEQIRQDILNVASETWPRQGIILLAITLEKIRQTYFEDTHQKLMEGIPSYSQSSGRYAYQEWYGEIVDLRDLIVHYDGELADAFLQRSRKQITRKPYQLFPHRSSGRQSFVGDRVQIDSTTLNRYACIAYDIISVLSSKSNWNNIT